MDCLPCATSCLIMVSQQNDLNTMYYKDVPTERTPSHHNGVPKGAAGSLLLIFLGSNLKNYLVADVCRRCDSSQSSSLKHPGQFGASPLVASGAPSDPSRHPPTPSGWLWYLCPPTHPGLSLTSSALTAKWGPIASNSISEDLSSLLSFFNFQLLFY